MTKPKGSKKERAVLRNFDDLLEEKNDPYSSIIKILYIAPIFNDAFKLMKTQELNELIVKRYKISEKRRDKKRYPLLLELKEELKKYNDIKLDQDIEPDPNILDSTSSDYVRFESKLKILENKSFIERPKRGYCRISKNFISNPFKNWIKNSILECPLESSATWWNSYLFFPKLKINEFSYKEIIELKCLLHQSLDSHSKINDFLGKIGHKKANAIWVSFIDSLECSDVSKFRFWLYTVENDFITSFSAGYYYLRKKKGIYRKRENELLYNDLLMKLEWLETLKYESYADKLLKDKEFAEWNSRFRYIVEKAFVNYVKKIKPKSSIQKIKKQYIKEYNMYIDEVHQIYNKMLLKYCETGFSTLVLFPDFIVHQALEHYGMSKKESIDLENAIKYNYQRHPFIEKFCKATANNIKKIKSEIDNSYNKNQPKVYNFKNILKKYYEKEKSERKIETTYFLKTIEFFKGFENDLFELGINNLDDLYTDLESISGIYTIPKLK